MKTTALALLCGLLMTLGMSCSDSTAPDGDRTPKYLPGLIATYSTGAEKIESPIFHGYWNDCAATGHNLYEGECTDVSDSPVNWAVGSFSASWEGYIYIPETGSYTFNSHYWVDGIIYIAINDSVVANLDTPGGGYSKTLSLTGKTWYPVSMTFESNGGSNNMHLGWTKPSSTWEIVPAENLGHK
jgi:hypothetical protein